MHVAAVSTLFFAALAAADSHGHARRFHHRRAINETMTSAMTTPPATEEAAPLTTLTVQQTIVHTITNCGKNITETTCGGKDATVEVVTKTIDLTTIVCPVTEADAISSSVIASAGSTAPVVVEATQTATEEAAPLTTEVAAPLTTLTVQQTIVHTITNCGKNITETTCGGKDATVEVVTKTIDLTTIVCPVTEADAISSSVIASAGSTAPVIVEATQTVVPVAEESDVSPSGPEPTPVEDVESSVLSYTLGPESSQTVITTTHFNTKTTSDYVTKYITYDNSPETVTVIAPVIPEKTTTLSSTITSTRTVTVPAGPTASDSDASPEGSNPACPGGESCPKTPSGSDNEVPSGNKTPAEGAEDCPAPVTVTETIALSTVTVTATPAPSAVQDNTGETKPVAEEPKPVIVDDVVYVVPTKHENATAPYATGNAGPSGFITKSRPSGTDAPIEPAPTGKGFFGY